MSLIMPIKDLPQYDKKFAILHIRNRSQFLLPKTDIETWL